MEDVSSLLGKASTSFQTVSLQAMVEYHSQVIGRTLLRGTRGFRVLGCLLLCEFA